MTSSIRAIDNFLPTAEHAQVWNFLCGPGWTYGAYSAEAGSRYFYKHFAGFKQSSKEYADPAEIEAELAQYPSVAAVWRRLAEVALQGQRLARCYANGMPAGVEGGVHLDSDVPDHYTAIYYPHPRWDADLGGETLFFNSSRDEILAAVYPRPNRLVIFPGVIPHVARPISSRANEMRITLMFKTAGASWSPAVGGA